MRIQFKEVILHNFLSFVHATMQLDRSGYTLIQGKNNNPVDNAYSNGSGKSALLEAIAWALTGETIRGSKDVLRITAHEKNNYCYVLLNFIVDSNEYEIYRQSNPSKLTLKVNGNDVSGKGIRDTDKILKEYLPALTPSLLGSVIILGQGLPQRFSNNTPSGRKEVLEKLSNSDVMIQDLKIRISNRKKELDDKIREQEDAYLKSTTQKQMHEDNLVKLTNKYDNLPEIDALKSELDLISGDWLDLTIKVNTINEKLEEERQNQLDCLSSKNTVIDEFNQEIEKLSKPFDLQLSDLNTAKIDIEAKIKYLRAEISKIKSIKDICPTCGQKLPNIEKPSTEVQENELEVKEKDLQTIKDLMSSKSNEKTNALIEVNKAKNDKIAAIEDEYRSINVRLSNLTIDLNNLTKKLTEKEKIKIQLESEINNFENTKKELEDSISTTKSSIEELTSKILYINNEKENLQEHLTVIQKMNTVITRDFRGYLLTSVIDFINKKAKEYSQEVFETDRINFCLDGNNISISYDDKEYENLSGGEKQKVDLIVQFSIRDMLCKYLNFSSNIIAVDELFDNLDSIGCEKVLNLISNKLSDVESIYIITHHSSIPIPFDRILTVTKGADGISRLDAI